VSREGVERREREGEREREREIVWKIKRCSDS